MRKIERNSHIADNAGLASIHPFLPESVYTNLPEPLNEIVTAFESREREIVFLSSLGALSVCLPRVFSIYDGKKIFVNLNLFIIAPPASGKGVMNWSKMLVDPIHEKMIKDSKLKQQEYIRLDNTTGIQKPELQIKILPGNVSSSKFYQHMQNAQDSLLIFESEADSLSNMFKQDWGDFSDIIRKAFHHEAISISRTTDDKYFEIKNPKLSIVTSGTPNQLKPLISSKENGLFSRFLFYYFDEIKGWKDVSPKAQFLDPHDIFTGCSAMVFELYEKLYNRQEALQIHFSENQWDTFQTEMRLFINTFIKNDKTDFLPVIIRHGNMSIRIAMILTALRNKEFLKDDILQLECSDEDMTTALEMIKNLIEHALFVFDLYSKNTVYLSMNERKLFSLLPEQFSRANGLPLALSSGIAKRTYADVLTRWCNNKIIEKISHGHYKKLKLS